MTALSETIETILFYCGLFAILGAASLLIGKKSGK